ncbi:hypothetical protein JMJ35_006422 [Cladonia borealis]|uniref:Uncharacterized protein n=1 Tax=Cladonia borealis TaxID=184061 RepID=A0AA39V7S6_9LECA|nr:hypothetical protein JMJ35_006422 [Cladonia borealis]
MPLDSFGLGPERSFGQITYLDFQHLCSNYGKANRDTFENLDYFRLSTVPEILQQRKQDGCPFMEKSELQILAEWRRKHDYQHGNTPKELASNSIKTVREISHSAFTIYGNAHHYIDAIKEFQRLPGVSFPIATLLLAEYDPVNIPYFTEGMYRWIREEDARAGTWDRRVDYIFKQYRVLIDRVAQLRGRLKEESGMDVTALDVERVGRQINESAVTRRNKLDNGEDDMLLRAPGTWSSKKQQKKLGTPLSEVEEVPQQSPAPSVPPAKTARKKAETVTPMQVAMLAGSEVVEVPTPTMPKFREEKRRINDGRWRPY